MVKFLTWNHYLWELKSSQLDFSVLNPRVVVKKLKDWVDKIESTKDDTGKYHYTYEDYQTDKRYIFPPQQYRQVMMKLLQGPDSLLKFNQSKGGIKTNMRLGPKMEVYFGVLKSFSDTEKDYLFKPAEIQKLKTSEQEAKHKFSQKLLELIGLFLEGLAKDKEELKQEFELFTRIDYDRDIVLPDDNITIKDLYGLTTEEEKLVVSYIKYLKAKLDKIGFGYLMTGLIKIANIISFEQARKMGVGHFAQEIQHAAGLYYPQKDRLSLSFRVLGELIQNKKITSIAQFAPIVFKDFFTKVVIHELGHRLYYKFLKDEFKKIYRGTWYKLNQNNEKNPEPTTWLSWSEYGMTKPEETWAENFVYYVFQKWGIDEPEFKQWSQVEPKWAKSQLIIFDSMRNNKS